MSKVAHKHEIIIKKKFIGKQSLKKKKTHYNFIGNFNTC